MDFWYMLLKEEEKKDLRFPRSIKVLCLTYLLAKCQTYFSAAFQKEERRFRLQGNLISCVHIIVIIAAQLVICHHSEVVQQ